MSASRKAQAKPRANIWQWIIRCSFGSIVCMGIFGVLLRFVPKIHEQQQAEARVAELKETEQYLRAKRDALREQTVKLQNDSSFIEQKSRDRLDMKRQGEEIFRFNEPADNR